MALTDFTICAFKQTGKPYRRADGSGLYIEIRPNGSKLWRLKYRFAGKEKRIGFGSYPEVSLSEARRRRDDARLKLRDGLDPSAERRSGKLLAKYQAANCFGDLGKEYIAKLVAEGRAITTTSKAAWLLDQLTPIAGRPIATLKSIDVLAALQRVQAQGKYETARRCRSFAGRVFRYGIATGRCETDPTLVLRGALITPKVRHHAALLDPTRVGELLRAMDAYAGHQVTRLAMQIAPHVMTRPGELRRAMWAEFDLENAVWKIPANRMKMRKTHSVPLSRQVVDYLEQLLRLTGPAGFVFPAFHTSRRCMSENTINQAFRRMGYASSEVTVHGLRTTASTLLNESGRWSADAIERSLAHVDKDVIRGTYNRGGYWGERVLMHQWWSAYLDELREQSAKKPTILIRQDGVAVYQLPFRPRWHDRQIPLSQIAGQPISPRESTSAKSGSLVQLTIKLRR